MRHLFIFHSLESKSQLHLSFGGQGGLKLSVKQGIDKTENIGDDGHRQQQKPGKIHNHQVVKQGQTIAVKDLGRFCGRDQCEDGQKDQHGQIPQQKLLVFQRGRAVAQHPGLEHRGCQKEKGQGHRIGEGGHAAAGQRQKGHGNGQNNGTAVEIFQSHIIGMIVDLAKHQQRSIEAAEKIDSDIRSGM